MKSTFLATRASPYEVGDEVVEKDGFVDGRKDIQRKELQVVDIGLFNVIGCRRTRIDFDTAAQK